MLIIAFNSHKTLNLKQISLNSQIQHLFHKTFNVSSLINKYSTNIKLPLKTYENLINLFISIKINKLNINSKYTIIIN